MNVLKNMKVGLSIGFVVTAVSTLIFNGPDMMSLQLIGWCIASAIYGGSSALFQIESIKIIYITLLHYFICLGTTLAMVYIFYNHDFRQLLGILTYFTIVYIIIYAVMTYIEKKQIKEINEHLSKR